MKNSNYLNKLKEIEERHLKHNDLATPILDKEILIGARKLICLIEEFKLPLATYIEVTSDSTILFIWSYEDLHFSLEVIGENIIEEIVVLGNRKSFNVINLRHIKNDYDKKIFSDDWLRLLFLRR